MITYELFEEKIYTEFKKYIGENGSIYFQDVTKDNGVIKRGMVIKPIDRNLAPTIYLYDYYEEYISGETLNNIFDRITNLYENSKLDDDIDLQYILDYEKIQDNIYVRLVNFESNKADLANRPHHRWLDLAVTYYIEISNPVIGNGIIRISMDMLKGWGIDENRLYEDALANTVKNKTTICKSMRDILNDKLDIFDGSTDCIADIMYILSNKQMKYGATVMLYPGFLRDIAYELDSDLYIIPCSIHELIVVDHELIGNFASALKMIAQVNNDELEAEEVLSNNMYCYCRNFDEVVLINGAKQA